MAQSLSRIFIHLIFSTKHRAGVLTPEIRSELMPYLSAVLKNNGCPPLGVGGVEDHVHLIFGLSRTMSLAKVTEIVKTSSSKWIKTKGTAFSQFHWQSGYGAFSIGPSRVDSVIRYVKNQELHHRKKTFQIEFLEFLHHYHVPYDERYVWD